MGKKTKIGKRRKDKFYHLAKETGYRARSAFKLVQLNRKYNFLQSSRVLIDLCAAPGGWLQVAAKSMPISSLIVGVDLVPIKPIPNVVAIQGDITTARCKQLIQRELKNWKADCVLNDGAPNVGAAWVQDAYSQAVLSLSALKLACSFLREGGWFISKIFRSKDYQPLMWVLNQLFEKVHATKPHASRIESAEIFVVCRGYLAPGVLDEKLLDPRHVFQEVEEEEKNNENINLVKLLKPSKAAEGYPDNSRTLFRTRSVADFVMEENHLSILRDTHQLLFDRASEVFSRHSLTTEEIQESCKDIKVLGPRELKGLVKWREKMRLFLEKVGSEGEDGGEGGEKMEEVGGGEDDGLIGIDGKVKELAEKEAAEVKREIRHLRKQRKKLKERLVVRGADEESGELIRQENLFHLKTIKTKSQLDKVMEGEGLEEDQEKDGSDKVESGDEERNVEESDVEDVSSSAGSDDHDGGDNSEEESEDQSEDQSNDEVDISPKLEQQPDNPLTVSFDTAAEIRSRKTKLWFDKPVFDKLLNIDDCDEIEQMVVSIGGEDKDRRMDAPDIVESKSVEEISSDETSSSDDDDDDGDYGTIKNVPQRSGGVGVAKEESSTREEDSFEVVPVDNTKKRKLDPEGLAIGALMTQSKKKREDLIESGYNRWTHNDENLPDWFVESESRFCQKRLPITKEMVEVYRAKLKEINARPIKKVAEAKARKKKRVLKSLEKARKKAESIVESEDVSGQEKAQQIKQIYKKAGVLGNKKKGKGKVEYVVAKRGMGKKVRRPAGVKGRFKMVDPRMKKDARGKAAKDKKKKRGKRKR